MGSEQTITLESEAGFQALFQYATVGILVINNDGRIELANPCILELFGYGVGELTGRPVEILIPEALRRKHVHHREGYFAHPKARPMGYGLTLYARRKNGTEFPVEISLGHYELAEERYAVAFITDISERIKAEEQARESEEEYRLMFERITESFILQEIVKDANGVLVDLRFLEVNPAAQKMIGKPRREIIGHLRSEFFGPLDDKFLDILARVEKGEHVKYQQYFQPLGRWFKRSFYLHKPGQVMTLSVDITDHKENEDALRNSQAMLESEAATLSFLNDCGARLAGIKDLQEGLREMLDDSIRLMGADKGNVQLLNREKQVLEIAVQKGFSEEFLEYFREVSAADSSACGLALNNRSQIAIADTETDASFADHRDIARSSGFRAVQSTPLYDEDGAPIGMISTHFASPHPFNAQELARMDLFARKAESFVERCILYGELEKKVEERTYELAQALEREKELGDMKSRFMSIASHEFRTPLSTILSSTSLIESYTKEEQDGSRKKHTARIKSSIRNLVDILNDFLSLDKLEQKKVDVIKESMNLRKLAADIIEEMGGLLKAGQFIELRYQGDENLVQDKKVLRNVLLNLLSNASKYSGENKPIVVSVVNGVDTVAISVRDEGIGIPKDDQKDLFSTFYRAKNASNIQGTGLGLHIVRRYVDLLEGNISFVSELDKGTTFTVEFPASASGPGY